MKESGYSAMVALAAGAAFVTIMLLVTHSKDSTIANETIDLSQVSIPDDLVITQERTACLGPCPAYQVQIRGNGTVYYEGHAFVSLQGTHAYNISQTEIARLVNEFNRMDFYSMDDRYGTIVIDAPTSRISIFMNGSKKDIVIGAGNNVPSELLELQNRIEKAAGINGKEAR